ncbi:MAG: thiamine pyrophosphate-dependent dehydrogenase E1 component subunit alpha [Rhodospirillaceae bacterium]|jgi:acetoin:2,6-dichlorophenolindophenol oxidoreductase subunit alpha|nr:thiamine pyrophosphate-dependent dehydrogenase E1 component subunit alpha [Rhodospirillaceae bacterium]
MTMAPKLNKAKSIELYRDMVTIRTFEEEVRKMFSAGLAPGLVHLYSGQEAVGVGTCAVLSADDYIASHHRGHGHCIAKGGDITRLFAEIIGRRPGYSLGRGGSMHIHDPETGNLGTNGIVGGSVPLATGAALSAKLRGTGQVAVSFFGDGVLNQGILFESMNMAALWSLPVVFVCENNGYGEFTEIDDVTAGRPYSKRGEAFDIPSGKYDGMDVLVVFDAVSKAVERARKGDGPSFLIFDTYRYSGHSVGDKQEYKDEKERQLWESRDPIQKMAKAMADMKLASKRDLEKMDEEISATVVAAAKEARKMPAPGADDLTRHIYAP